jgi:prepilin-type processing-associated H-X9-DG protein/prepilin-type N-terminal cleavage/methylation domain-containing protein
MTLIEVLVTMSVIAVLASLVVPKLAGARAGAMAVMCKSNLNQVVRANLYYADENDGYHCPGAINLKPKPGVQANLHRWFGTRSTTAEAFDPRGGALTPYLGEDGAIRQCPSFQAEEVARRGEGFERACGGYAYNNAFVGRQVRQRASGAYELLRDDAGAAVHVVRRPAETAMFADAAFAENTLVEYSFIEPRFHPSYPAFRADPSTHFRHRGSANIGWVDGHVDARGMTFTWRSGVYAADPGDYDIGWFGETDDNKYYDLD